MSDGIPAIYDNGVFRPIGPVELPDQAVVRVFPAASQVSPTGDGIRASAGAWADAGEDFDKWLANLQHWRSMPRGSSERRADKP